MFGENSSSAFRFSSVAALFSLRVESLLEIFDKIDYVTATLLFLYNTQDLALRALNKYTPNRKGYLKIFAQSCFILFKAGPQLGKTSESHRHDL
jgi:hypothetical protein